MSAEGNALHFSEFAAVLAEIQLTAFQISAIYMLAQND